jgi:3-deoxy-D-manno-octulosonate 8-phosphate phosphatase (KDO 8-P phosphatase)
MDNITRASAIKCFVFDVDGTLTDGRIYMGEAGELCKAFHAKDGLAIRLAGQLGYKTVIITGRTSRIVERRAKELAICALYQGVLAKKRLLEEVCRQFYLTAEEVAYMGDDVNDLPAMRLAGLACAPRDAAAEVKQVAHFIAEEDGGRGAARSAVEFVLTAQGRWEKVLAVFAEAGE